MKNIDLSGLNAKELGNLIRTAKKQQTIVAKRKSITVVRARLTKLAIAEGYTLQELFGTAGPARSVKSAPGSRKPAKAKRNVRSVAPKYRDPKNPALTWTGRGRQPRWVVDAVAGGTSLDKLLISNSADAAVAPGAGE